jgi:hypothetical protein
MFYSFGKPEDFKNLCAMVLRLRLHPRPSHEEEEEDKEELEVVGAVTFYLTFDVFFAHDKAH